MPRAPNPKARVARTLGAAVVCGTKKMFVVRDWFWRPKLFWLITSFSLQHQRIDPLYIVDCDHFVWGWWHFPHVRTRELVGSATAYCLPFSSVKVCSHPSTLHTTRIYCSWWGALEDSTLAIVCTGVGVVPSPVSDKMIFNTLKLIQSLVYKAMSSTKFGLKFHSIVPQDSKYQLWSNITNTSVLLWHLIGCIKAGARLSVSGE